MEHNSNAIYRQDVLQDFVLVSKERVTGCRITTHITHPSHVSTGNITFFM